MVEHEKHFFIAAGPNGSGKSTFARQFLKKHDYIFLNADEIAREINPEQMDMAKLAAGRVFFKRLATNIEAGNNVLIESTLSGMYLHRFFPRIRSLGYKITIIFVFLEHPRICIERIKERVIKGGHHVPDADVVRRFYRSKRNLWFQYRFEVDNWYLFFNSEDRFLEIAFGKKEDYIIKNNEIFNLYLQDVI